MSRVAASLKLKKLIDSDLNWTENDNKVISLSSVLHMTLVGLVVLAKT